MQLIMDKGTTDRPLPGDCHCIENSKASLVYWFETGSHVGFTLLMHMCEMKMLTGSTVGFEWYPSSAIRCRAED